MKIGEISGLQVMVTPETYKEMQKQKTIEENKILKEQQEEIERLNNIIEKAVEYISSNCILSREWEEVEFCKFLAIESITYKALPRGKIKELLNILNGRSDE